MHVTRDVHQLARDTTISDAFSLRTTHYSTDNLKLTVTFLQLSYPLCSIYNPYSMRGTTYDEQPRTSSLQPINSIPFKDISNQLCSPSSICAKLVTINKGRKEG